MMPDAQLDCAIFRLTPTRTRCELYIFSGGISEKLASGLVKPFLDHLETAAKQIAKGGCSIQLQPPDPNGTAWFSKGTMERFVRFVSTPEVLERVSTVEMELTQLEQTINAQNISESGREDDLNINVTAATSTGLERAVMPSKSRLDSSDIGDSSAEGNYKIPLLRALDARRVVLQKEQGMAFARATAAGFGLEQITDLIAFADYFGAARLREACFKYKALRKKKQEAGLWLEETDLAGLDPTSAGSETHFAVMTGNTHMATYVKSKDHPELWPDLDGKIEPNDEEHNADKTSNMTGRVFADEAFLNAEKQHAPHYLVPEEVSSFLQHSVDGKGFPEEHRNSETGRMGIARAYQALASWQGQPQQFIQTASHLPPGMVHAFPQSSPLSVQAHYESPYAFGGSARGPQAIIPPNPNYLGNSPFLQCHYLDNNSPSVWHAPDATAKQVGQVHIPSTHNWPTNQVYGDTFQSDSQQFPMGSAFSPQQHDATSSPIPSRDEGAGVYIPPKVASSKLNETARTKRTPEDDDSHSSSDTDYKSPAGVRRLLRRSTSPRRRSPSPMRKVKIGHSGSRRSSMVVIRNINYIAPKSQDHSSKKGEEEDVDESSGSWGEENDIAVNNGENIQSKVDSLQTSVQDALEAFETSQKGLGEANKKSSKYDGHRKERLRSKSRDISVDAANSERSEDSNIGATLGETKYNSETLRPRDKSDSILSEGEIDAGSSNGIHKSSNFCKSFENEMTFLPARVSQRPWNLNNIVALESEIVSPEQPFRLNKQVVEDDVLVMTAKGEAVQNHMLSRSIPGDDSEVNVSLGSHWCHVSEEAQIFPKRDRVDGKMHEFSCFEMLAEQEENALQRKSSTDFSNEQQQPTHSSLDDSFIVPERFVGPEQSNSGWRTAMNIDFEMPGYDVGGKNATGSQEPEDMLGILQRNSAGASTGRPWNSVFDYDTQISDEIATNKLDNNENKDESEILVQQDLKGNLYNEYSEKRDAKIKEQPINKAEREAKLKEMHEALEKRKTEMEKNRKLEKTSPLVEAQLRAEKLRAFKANLQRTKKEKEEEERKRLEELIIQRKERIATRSGRSSVGTQPAISTSSRSKSLGSTSRTSAVSKFSPVSVKAGGSGNSTPRDSIQARKSISPNSSKAIGISQNSHKSLSYSISSLSELCKQNNRNSTLRASTGSQPMTVFKSSGQAGHLKSVKDASTSTNGQVEKHPTRNAVLARKTASDTRGMISTTKTSKNSLNGGNQKHQKIAATYPLQVTKHVQKARSESRQNEDGHSEQDIAQLLSDSMFDGKVVENNSSEIVPKVDVAENVAERNEAEKIESGYRSLVGVSKAPVAILEKTGSDPPMHENIKDVAMINGSLNHVKAAEVVNEMVLQHSSTLSTTELNEQCVLSSNVIKSPPKLKTLLHHDSVDIMSPDFASTTPLDCASKIDGFDLLDLNACADPSSDSMPLHETANVRPFASVSCPTEPLMPSDHVVDSSSIPVINFPVQSTDFSLPQLQQSVSPISCNVKADLSSSRKKQDNTEKSAPSGSQSNAHMKGLKRLLKFGRKSSRSSGNNISEWVSVATSEGDDNMDEKGDLGGRSNERKEKSVGDRYSSFNTSSNGHGHNINSNGFDSQASVNLLKGSKSALPTNYKSQDDHSFEGTPVKAPRLFFSLSTFRSKASEGKSR